MRFCTEKEQILCGAEARRRRHADAWQDGATKESVQNLPFTAHVFLCGVGQSRPAFLRDLNAPLLFWGHSRASVCCEKRRKLLYFNLLNEHHLGRESIVQLEQRQTLSQKLVLTQTMRQSLDCLQLSAPELTEYVQEVALSNQIGRASCRERV